MDITGKIIVVTGGGGGIGEALCRRFSAEGAKTVVVADVNEEAARSVAEDIRGIGVHCDAGNKEDMEELILRTEERVGPVDLFCSNAGIITMGGVEVSDDQWQKIWEINVLSHIRAARILVPRMIERGGGAFMITASAAGLLSQIGSVPYSATKHAAVGLAESIAITCGDQGIQVFVLCPQAVRSDMTRQNDGGGVAAVDGLMEPEQVAQAVMQGIGNDTFLILPHPEVHTYMERKAADYDRWIRGMRRLKARYPEGADLKG